MSTAPDLKSERLAFHDMTLNDASFVVRLRTDPEVYPFFTNPRKITVEEHIDWYSNRYIYDDNRYDWVAFNAQNKPVGVFGAKRESNDNTTAEISYILDPQFYGVGYASEAVMAVIDFCKNNWSCNKVIAEIHKENARSVHFICKLGFTAASESDVFIIFEKEI